jgi:hypothetical protein
VQLARPFLSKFDPKLILLNQKLILCSRNSAALQAIPFLYTKRAVADLARHGKRGDPRTRRGALPRQAAQRGRLAN